MNISVKIVSISFICLLFHFSQAQDIQKTFLNSPIYKTTTHEGVFLSRDLTQIVSYVSSKTDKDIHYHEDEALWLYYVNKPHPDVQTLQTYFQQAASEYGVPAELLMAIGYVENNWTQVGPSIDRGWGIMHLVENNYCNTLHEAADLLHIDKQVLKENALQNIRGAAALLAKYAGKNKNDFKKNTDWFEASKKISGLINDELREKQAERYFTVLKTGVSSKTLWEETIIIKPHPDINIDNNLYQFHRNNMNRSPDYPSAIWNSNTQSPNFNSRGDIDIDTWVNHYIGVGTYAGAISWFLDPGSQVSAHFVIRSSDGEISQCVLVKDRAWHCGATGTTNNSRSVGIEHEATIVNPELWNSTSMLKNAAGMACYFCTLFEIPKSRSYGPIGIAGHNEMPGCNTECPGALPWYLWMSFLVCGSEISDNRPDKNTLLYPNPTNGKIHFLNHENTIVSVYHTTGELIKTVYGSDTVNSFDISNCSDGLYLIRIITGKEILYRKVLLVK